MRGMSTKRFPLAWLALGLVLVVSIGVASRMWRTVRAGNEEPTTAPPVEAVESSLVDLRHTPAAWLGKPVRFIVQFRGVEDTWNPFHTRFGTADWQGFTGWADERFTWDPEVYEAPSPRLFVRRGSAAPDTLAAATAHGRFEVEAVVREVFLDEPWIEVFALTPLGEHVPPGTILHVNRGRTFLSEGHLGMAREQFDRALAAPLPAHARVEIERLRGLCDVPSDDE